MLGETFLARRSSYATWDRSGVAFLTLRSLICKGRVMFFARQARTELTLGQAR